MYLAAAGQIGLSANGKPVLRSTDVTMVIGQIGGADDVDVTLYGDLALAGNMAFTGTARRITGDFSNATVASRVMFQTSTTNGETSLGVIPNGTSPNSGVNIFNAANPTNAAFGGLLVGATEFQIRSAITGSGTYLPMTFYTGGSERVRIDTSGNVGIGANATNRLSLTYNGGTGEATFGPNSTSGSAFLTLGTSNAGSYSERVRIDSSGNVGIGTTSPANKFVVSNNGAAGLEITPDGLASNPILVSFNRSTSAYGQLSFGSDFLVFCTNGTTEQARITSAGLLQFNSGYGSVATAFGCRAWINFDGTLVTNPASTTGIRGSGNVSSVLDNGTGDYTINFTNAMPDGNYAPVFGYGQSESSAAYKFAVRLTTSETGAPTTMTTTALRVISGGTSNLDFANLYVAIFR
jgi:hypothetical protein